MRPITPLENQTRQTEKTKPTMSENEKHHQEMQSRRLQSQRQMRLSKSQGYSVVTLHHGETVQGQGIDLGQGQGKG